ncbi:MAG TPA: SDR family oxidoreductase [Acidimicrobiales bacterium]|nr:SDR family oxidoreductase [Acidimicrobiales bacterium]
MGEGTCERRSVIVTGAGRGLGRAHALELARQGASVVVNDLGVDLDGSGGSPSPADDVAAEIRAAGGEAISNADDVADFDAAEHLVANAVAAFGHLDAVVNNAGHVRDRMFVNTTEDEWDSVIRVHLKGHFSVAHWAAVHWRDQHKSGGTVDARIVNTSSGAGLVGSVGQAAYSAAKAAIAALTLVQAAELGRYGVTANALAPSARTRMTEAVFAETMAAPTEPGAFDAMAPENVSPLVAWLCSAGSHGVTGQVLEVEGGRITLMSGWNRACTATKAGRWEASELGPIVAELLARAPAGLRVYGTQ